MRDHAVQLTLVLVVVYTMVVVMVRAIMDHYNNKGTTMVVPEGTVVVYHMDTYLGYATRVGGGGVYYKVVYGDGTYQVYYAPTMEAVYKYLGGVPMLTLDMVDY